MMFSRSLKFFLSGRSNARYDGPSRCYRREAYVGSWRLPPGSDTQSSEIDADHGSPTEAPIAGYDKRRFMHPAAVLALRLRVAYVIALRNVAAPRHQQLVGSAALDTFSHDLLSQLVGQFDGRAPNRRVALVFKHVHHEGLVDLDSVDGQFAQIAQ